MHLKELTHRSPLRVFERSVHGGVGKGNIGVVASRAGVGKSAFLTCIGLDDLLRGHKVLHVTMTHGVDHVRAFYDEMFADLSREANLEETVVARDLVEHNRFIRSLNGKGFTAEGLAGSLDMLRKEASFRPDLVIVDGWNLDATPEAEVAAVRELARSGEFEVWVTHRVPRPEPGADWHVLPSALSRLGDLVGVCVLLQPVGDSIRIRLLKDHDNPELADLTLDLDPRTFLIRSL
jgi:hypothetical protein